MAKPKIFRECKSPNSPNGRHGMVRYWDKDSDIMVIHCKWCGKIHKKQPHRK